MKNKIKDLILRGRFLEAKKEIPFINCDTLKNVLYKIAFDEHSICAYTFLAFLIREHEILEYHAIARIILEIGFCHIEGAYETALYHTYRSIELSPDDIDLQESLLFLTIFLKKLLQMKKLK